jgi:hypothetical protein
MACYKEGMNEDYVALYRQAFKDFGAMVLWNVRQVVEPTREDALAITGRLRTEGDAESRELAERIERACATLAG